MAKLAAAGDGVPIEVGIHEAKTRLSELLRLVDGGQVVNIFRGNTPVAKVVPFRTAGSRQLGIDQGVFQVPDDFDDPLPDEILRGFTE